MSSAFMSSRLVTWEHLASFQKCLALLTRTQSIIIFHNSLMKVAQSCPDIIWCDHQETTILRLFC